MSFILFNIIFIFIFVIFGLLDCWGFIEFVAVQFQFDATVSVAALLGSVTVDGVVFSESGIGYSCLTYAFTYEVSSYLGGSAEGQAVVVLVASYAVGVAVDAQSQLRVIL